MFTNSCIRFQFQCQSYGVGVAKIVHVSLINIDAPPNFLGDPKVGLKVK